MKSKKKKYNQLKGNIILLEGTIGVGKTTLGKALTKFLNSKAIHTKFYAEFKNEKLLNQYIKDMPKYAYPFQVIIARERVHIYSEAYRFAQNGGVAIIDRSLIGDYVFASMQRDKGFFSEEEWDVYNSLIQTNIPEPFAILYLEATPEIVYQRMINRGDPSEKSGYQIQYFQDLDATYNQVIGNLEYAVIKLDWNKNRKIVGTSVCKYVLDQLLS